MELEKITKKEARKLFNAKQPLVIVTVNSVGEERDRLELTDFEYNHGYGVVGAYNYNFDEILERYTGYTYYNRYTRSMKWVYGRKKYYKVVA